MDEPIDRPERDVDDPSGLVTKLRNLGQRNGERETDFRTRVFGSLTFFRLWVAQAVTSMGDWLGFLAILALAKKVGWGTPGTSMGLVVAARIIPGFFFSAAAGVLIDRMDRKQVMVATTLARAGVVAALPFVDNVVGLVFASLVLELATLMFSPAKEATVPNLVPAERLASSNSLSLAAAYGTFPVAALLFAFLAKVSEWLGAIEVLDALKTSQAAVALYANMICYVIAAVIIARLAIPRDHIRLHEDESIDLTSVFTEVKEGWHFAFLNPVVRAVNIGLATGLLAGGMLIPLGQEFAEKVLEAGPSGFGVFVAALGLGVAGGIIGVSARQATIPKQRAFVIAEFGAGVACLVGVSMWNLPLAALAVMVMGIFAGAVYVLGFTLLHEIVEDELRGRVFAGLYTLVRLCVLLSMAIGPILNDVLDGLSQKLVDRHVDIGFEIYVPGVRLTLWFAGSVMVLASGLAAKSLKSAPPVGRAVKEPAPP